jgi:magnesium chelatase family protein
MLSCVTSFVLDGLTARAVRVEVDVHRGLPEFAIVGLPDRAVRESRQRIRAALVNSGYEFPLRRVVVNVAPASVRRAAPGLDLAIATALLGASEQLDRTRIEAVALIGELGLDGRTRAVDGALAVAEAARELGIATLAMPTENGPEAALAGALDILPLHDLTELPAIGTEHAPHAPSPMALPIGREGLPDFADLRGRSHLQFPLEVAAAGGHGLLLVGTAGSGKSLIASRLPSILPALTTAEALDIVRVASANGRRGPDAPAGRPFRAPHHTISTVGLIGGGNPTRPGEITMAHHGVLYLDELCEFRREALEALRAPLESGEVSIARVSGRRRLPCRFMLVAGSTPCACGRDPEYCVCRPLDRARFGVRIAGGLGEHLPIRLELSPPTRLDLAGPPWQSSAVVRKRVERARSRAERRLGVGRTNADMTAEEVQGVPLTSEAVKVLAAHQARQPIPRSAPDQTIRLARTVADLAGREFVGEGQMRLALNIRGEDRPEAAG